MQRLTKKLQLNFSLHTVEINTSMPKIPKAKFCIVQTVKLTVRTKEIFAKGVFTIAV